MFPCLDSSPSFVVKALYFTYSGNLFDHVSIKANQTIKLDVPSKLTSTPAAEKYFKYKILTRTPVKD